MMSNSKELTAPQPHRIVKEMSLFLGKFQPQPNNEGWSFTKELQNDDGYMKVTSIKKVDAHDGKMFDFVMSSLFAQNNHHFKGKTKDIRNVDVAAYGAISIDIQDVLEYRGIKNRTENRQAIFNSLKNMVGMTVEVKKGKVNIVYSVLTSVHVDEVNPHILHVKVNDEINKAFSKAGMRFNNVERALKLKSDVAVEFTKFLQLRGQGIRNGKPTSPQSFEHSDVVFFLHLEHLTEADQIRTVSRAIKAVVAQGFDNYKMKRLFSGIKWIKH